ncbi:MAG: TIGR01458 family HAD-type hydrolase [Pseudomonadota bacterium]
MTQGVLLDLAGVLYDGTRPVAGAAEAVARLRAAGLPLRFLTNSTRRSRKGILHSLAGMGFDIAAKELLTPAAAACDWLRREGRAPHLLVHPDLEEDFKDVPRTGPPAVVLGDAGQFFTYERLNAAFRVLNEGAPFLALAANRTFRDADGALSMDAGAFVQALEYSSGTRARLFGKPSASFFQAGVAQLGCDAATVIMIGDDAESDVAGAISAGVGHAVLVQTGKYQPGDETRFTPAPSAVAPDISSAVLAILRDV